MRAAALVVAGGNGARLGAGVPKAFVDLGGRSVLAGAVAAVGAAEAVAALVVVVPGGCIERARAEVQPVLRRGCDCQLVVGGRTRQESVRNGVRVVPECHELILVHDAARPLVPSELVAQCLRVAAETGAAVAALPVSDTVKEVSGDGAVVATLERSRLRVVQTPQAFRAALLRDAHERAAREGFEATDDAALVERYGSAVWTVPGDPANIKITTAADLAWARWVLARAAGPR